MSAHESREAMLIYGGRNCSFDNSVLFVEDNARHNPAYRFIAGGFLLYMPHRRTLCTVHSQPWSSERMVVSVLRDGAKRSFKFQRNRVFQTTSIERWSILIGFMCLFCIALGIHSYRFSQAKIFRELIRRPPLSRPSERRVCETVSWPTLRLAVVVFFAVSILLYEVSYLILSDPVNISNVEDYSSLGLNKNAVLEGEAYETTFR